MLEKIKSVEELIALRKEAVDRQQKVVLCHGTFDLLHTGHIRHLQAAKRAADILIATLTADEFVTKGPGRPVFNEKLRAGNLAALQCVDFVAIIRAKTAVELLYQLKPDIYAKGSEFKDESIDVAGYISAEREVLQSYGGEILLTDEVTFSSTQLLNNHFDIFSAEVRLYLDEIKKYYTPSLVASELDRLKNLKVLVVGEAIIDEYHYTNDLGQSGKSHTLVVQHKHTERFAGGSLAVANHIAGFCQQVELLTVIGDWFDDENFIRANLKSNVTPHFYYLDSKPTLTKARFVNGDMSKLFEVYYNGLEYLNEETEQQINGWLDKYLNQYDCVVVSDFGNGFISRKMVERLVDKSRFLAVNTQINSGNRGFHVITRYPKANFISLNEPEIRLAAHNRHDPIEEVAENIGEKLGVRYIAITQGERGATYVDRVKQQSVVVPALSTQVVDRIGAGDAVLSITSILLSCGVDLNVVGLLGNAAGALKIKRVCNSHPIEMSDLIKYLKTLLS
ncbi:cytidyltransferase [Ectothiorhodospiraceae bacterium BW-2]|nr:cytidyltransferase [Ectothiorhodospiraceae bacterium BW-2]